MFENGMAACYLPMPCDKLYCFKFLAYILPDLLYQTFLGKTVENEPMTQFRNTQALNKRRFIPFVLK